MSPGNEGLKDCGKFLLNQALGKPHVTVQSHSTERESVNKKRNTVKNLPKYHIGRSFEGPGLLPKTARVS